jgi:RNA polymerase sigma factor (sigma-70 family)
MTDHLSDARLLERFVARRDEAAFATLVKRHGPAVLGACRHVLRDENDAEDVLQATFLVLARRAGDLPWRDSVRGWLCAVARRLALNARGRIARRSRRECPVAALAACGDDPDDRALPEDFHPSVDPFPELVRRELRDVLRDELDLLPEKYRAPVVLCYLEGLTSEEAARALGWPVGSMSRRLERARSLLKPRLASRGLLLGLAILCGILVLYRDGRRPAGMLAGRAPVREAMGEFRPREEGGQDLGRLLERVASDDRDLPSWEEILLVARGSAAAADRIDDYDPGHERAEWRRHVGEMREAALALARSARERDRGAAVDAARRLNLSCLGCHDAFHASRGPHPDWTLLSPETMPGPPPDVRGTWPVPIPLVADAGIGSRPTVDGPPLIVLGDIGGQDRRAEIRAPSQGRLNLSVEAGEFPAPTGPSGPVKTTLPNLIAGLTAEENVELPLLLTHPSLRQRREDVRMPSRAVGLEGRGNHDPRQLSGGRERRVAIVTDPHLLVDDEPTGDLDRDEGVLEPRRGPSREFGNTIVLAAHAPPAVGRAGQPPHPDKGRLVDDVSGPSQRAAS